MITKNFIENYKMGNLFKRKGKHKNITQTNILYSSSDSFENTTSSDDNTAKSYITVNKLFDVYENNVNQPESIINDIDTVNLDEFFRFSVTNVIEEMVEKNNTIDLLDYFKKVSPIPTIIITDENDVSIQLEFS